VRCDVSDRERVAQLFANFGHSQPPLRGIIHAAGTLDDGVLNQQSWERFERVMAPKVDGAWYLHTLSQDQPLDFFVLFSSAVSMLGSAGQANHVAACAFEDALAHYRRAQGLPALSINWGPWAETGAATQGTLSERLQTKGFRLIDSERGLRLLERLMLRNRAQVGAMSADWRLYGESFPRSPHFRSGSGRHFHRNVGKSLKSTFEVRRSRCLESAHRSSSIRIGDWLRSEWTP
jgi:hypothetical protein